MSKILRVTGPYDNDTVNQGIQAMLDGKPVVWQGVGYKVTPATVGTVLINQNNERVQKALLEEIIDERLSVPDEQERKIIGDLGALFYTTTYASGEHHDQGVYEGYKLALKSFLSDDQITTYEGIAKEFADNLHTLLYPDPVDNS